MRAASLLPVLPLLLVSWLETGAARALAEPVSAQQTAEPTDPASPADPADSVATANSGSPLREGLMWNARERTARAIDRLRGDDPASALPAFDTALRLKPEDPRTRFNAGSARIGVDPKAAAELLDSLAPTAPDALASDTWYNLGNARLANQDAQGALEAYVEALRREPSRLDAKYNLELAQRQLENQRQQQAQQQRQEGQQDGEERSSRSEQSPSGQGDEQQQSREQEPGDTDAGQEPQQPDGQAGSAAGPTGGEQRESPLPQFRDLPDMTAEQAAAILQAVENLERRQRRKRAIEAAAQRAQVEIDW